MTLTDVLALERPLIGVDTETTGTNPQNARICEIALEIMSPDKSIKEYRTLINPGIPIPPGATKVHGITDAMVKACRVCGMGAEDTDAHAMLGDNPHTFAPWPFFSDLADRLVKGFTNVDFCGYNVRFDLRMFAAEFKRARKVWDYESARVIDAFRLWQIIDPRSLEDAVDKWLTEEEKANGYAHSALSDVRWSTRVVAQQLRACAKLPRDLQHLHDLCAPGWFDAEGKLQWQDGELVMGFGEHKGMPLRRLPRSYVDFILRKDFSDKVKDTVRNAMRGVFPTPPQTSFTEEHE